MAEIKIKKKTPIVPWILGLILLAAVLGGVYFAFQVDDIYEKNNDNVAMADELPDNEITPVDDATVVGTELIPLEVNTFVAFANEENGYEEDAEMGVHHEYTGKSLRYMGDAIVALAEQKGMTDEINAKALHSDLDAAADDIQKNWKETDHADHIRAAFLKVSTALNKLAYTSNDTNLKKEARDIDPNTLTLNQKSDVKEFIDKTAMVMQKIAMEE
ncbi:hypothetical protein [Bernardetia sp.]|uniref:hypothetical protein n=1 Tax=Bernardetia sp. TaxID=1937974 RepID=UPI0025BA0E3D|nr:hypothetical protein [Bernardetia sp.]